MPKNKLESDNMIKKLGLNRIIQNIFTKDSIDDLKSFLQEHPCAYYNMRDKSRSDGKFFYKITADEVLNNIDNYENRFSVYESLAPFDDRLIIQGEIIISADFVMQASLSDVKNIPNREAMDNPKYKLFIDLKKENEPDIRGLKKVINYIINHNLFNLVVEFSMFEVPVGINKENIIIWELRDYYDTKF